MLQPGDSVGPYQVVSLIGAGGMGEVYRALDARVGRQVALKVLPDSLAADEDRRRRFEQEARLAAGLNHPNIMAIYDVGLDQHPPYIVAELIEGESLRAVIGRGPVAPRKVADIGAQVADALACAHAAGIVHRDLKPDNIMLTGDGVAKILDFGVARMASRKATSTDTVTMAQTVAGAVVGTAAYMSPEQACAKDVDHRSDQFSLGLVLHEAITGKAAFERPSAVQTMSAIVEDEPPPIERPMPAQLGWILTRCLSKEPQNRYESTRDLARDLAQVRDHYAELTASTNAARAVAPAAVARFVPIAAAVFAGAVVTWCVAALLRDYTAVDIERYHLKPFATEFTRQFYPAWSPDGKSIAFLGNAHANNQVFVQAIDAANAVAITQPDLPVYNGPPVWSPDSRMIYFRCGMNGAQMPALCRIPASGGAPTFVQADVAAATISPDGKTLVWWPTGLKAEDLFVWTASPPDGARQKYEPVPLHPHQTYNNPTIAFSPDGRHILLSVAQEGPGETSWLLPWPAGNGRQLFRDGPGFTFTPPVSWMPDSRHVLFSESTASRPRQLYIEDTEHDHFWPVLLQQAPPVTPTVAPDGARAAYSSELSQSDIIEVPLADGAITTVLGSSRNEVRVDASRTTPQVVYVTDRRGKNELWVKSLAEGTERPLLTPSDVEVDGGPAHDFLTPAFSPDGKRVVVPVKGKSGVYLFSVVTAGGAPVRVTSATPAFELGATWSPDSAWLAYYGLQGGSVHLLKVHPGSGEAPVDLGPYYSGAMPVWSPTGEWIASHRTGDDHLVLISPDSGKVREMPGDWGPVAWSNDGKTLYQIRGDNPALVAIDVAAAKARTVRELPDLPPFSNGTPGFSAALTSDGKSIVYAVNRPRTEIWIIEGLQIPAPWYRRIFSTRSQ